MYTMNDFNYIKFKYDKFLSGINQDQYLVCQSVAVGQGHGKCSCNPGNVLFDVIGCYMGVGLDFCFCVINSHKLSGLKQDKFVTTVSVVRESRRGLAGSTFKVLQGCSLGGRWLCSFVEFMVLFPGNVDVGSTQFLGERVLSLCFLVDCLLGAPFSS